MAEEDYSYVALTHEEMHTLESVLVDLRDELALSRPIDKVAGFAALAGVTSILNAVRENMWCRTIPDTEEVSGNLSEVFGPVLAGLVVREKK